MKFKMPLHVTCIMSKPSMLQVNGGGMCDEINT